MFEIARLRANVLRELARRNVLTKTLLKDVLEAETERRIAYILLDANQVRVVARTIPGKLQIDYIKEWFMEDYDAIVSNAEMQMSALTKNEKKIIQESFLSEDGDAYENLLRSNEAYENLMDLLLNGHLSFLAERVAVHRKMVVDYKDELRLCIKELDEEIERNNKEIEKYKKTE